MAASERLYDDAGFDQGHRRRAWERAAVWEPDRLRAGAGAFLRRPAGAPTPSPDPR